MPEKSLRFIFDGDILEDSNTFESLDIDEDEEVTVDVKIDKQLYDNAVAATKRKVS